MKKICLVAIDIRSAHNVGAFFRTADGFGAEIMLTGITPRPKGAKDDSRLPFIAEGAHTAIAKTSLGAELTVKWRYCEQPKDALMKLKKEGFHLYAIEQSEDSQPISNLHAHEPVALVVGPEVTGLPADIVELCEKTYEIPMQGTKESFNVSVAAAIALYQASSI